MQGLRLNIIFTLQQLHWLATLEMQINIIIISLSSDSHTDMHAMQCDIADIPPYTPQL